jgi:hypothetical protein
VCCQPVVLASGKPHARSVFRQFLSTAGAGGSLGFGGAGVVPEDAGGAVGDDGGAAALGDHSEGALGGGGVGGGGADVSFFLHAISPTVRSRTTNSGLGLRNGSIIWPPAVNARRYLVEIQPVGLIRERTAY